MAFELTHSKDSHKIENGIQFYWSQKKAENAQNIYSRYLSKDAVILDPFLGAGSSLYGIRNSAHKFVGVELNELPYFLCNYNSSGIDQEKIDAVQTRFNALREKHKDFYSFISENNEKYFFEKIIFEDLATLEIKKIELSKSDGSKSSSEVVPESITKYQELYHKYKELNKEIKDLKLVKNSRIAVKEEMWVSNIFSPLNFHLLSLIFEEIQDDPDLQFILLSSLHLCRFTDLKSQSQFPYWVPNKNAVDRNIFGPIERKIKSFRKMTAQTEIKLVNGFEELIKTEGKAAYLLNKPAQEIDSDIPDLSIDFILTDPPYFDQVAYSEYLKIWELFSGLKSNLDNEIVVSQRERFKSDEANYLKNLKKVFTIVQRKLKDNGKMLIYFKDSRPDKMSAFLDVVESSGFVFTSQEYIRANKYTYKQNTSKKATLNGDNLLIFRKSDSKQHRPKIASKEEAKRLLSEYITSYMNKNGNITLGKLVSEGLYQFLYSKGALRWFKKIGEIVEVLEKNYAYSAEKRSYYENK